MKMNHILEVVAIYDIPMEQNHSLVKYLLNAVLPIQPQHFHLIEMSQPTEQFPKPKPEELKKKFESITPSRSKNQNCKCNINT
jgi:hypothetical protein